MATEVVGLFDNRDAANSAAQALERAGYRRSDISVEAYDANSTGSASTTGQKVENGWDRMMEKLHLMAPSHERDYYSQGLRPGQTLVSVSTTDDAADGAADILDQQGALNIDDHSSQYYADRGVSVPAGYDNTLGYGNTVANTNTVAADTANGTTIPVVEEELAVGKRQVRRGGVRVYQQVTERPVEEQVTLRDETVTVDRRPANRAATDADFQNQDFTVTETDEEAVVAKNARVVEEVVVGKTAQERTETVRDNVRRTDVQVEQLDNNTRIDPDNQFDTDEMLDEEDSPRVIR